MLRIVPLIESGRIIYQSGTGDSTLSLLAAQCVENDVSGIDVNMGCPKKFSVSGGMGSALLSDLTRASDIIKTLRRNISLPISAKIRLLKDTSSTVDFVKGLIQSGLNAVTIHAREIGDESIEPAKLDRLIEVVQLIKSSIESSTIPIIVNGDLYTRNDMVNTKRKCGADSVMIARPAIYNTSLFRKPTIFSLFQNDTKIGNDDIITDTTAQTILLYNPPKNINKIQEETRYGYNSQLLLSKNTVVQDYLRYSSTYYYNFQNIKYVVCEMINNRRTPPSLVPFLPQKCTFNISQVCKCKNLNDLCSLWGVTSCNSVSTAILRSNINVNTSYPSIVLESDTHYYDDKYFFDAESFRKRMRCATFDKYDKNVSRI